MAGHAYGVSRNHLMKVVNDLVNAGYLESVRGRFGGVRLARPASDINVGAVVRHAEGRFDLADCESCVISPVCGLRCALREALAAFMSTLNRYSLADVTAQREAMSALFARRKSGRSGASE